ncbi:LPXTG cell wall anchor domain-containing protein [Solwaraspora sp. WMMD406]|uniref:LPXTG cell wall anchor domain-containing protein n=1 Tax=Solwaraspora sp. WMMD406 TaxID=3016095 RepID=UPI00241648A0|nr:LPXTG cell wall anchor domain-containing protein [Solwaraspora sp. WMMD406]MDG4762721.1 LPXTG cell wall anchor domain-containing protein [Solwaraspora sp. WMMD406]
MKLNTASWARIGAGAMIAGTVVVAIAAPAAAQEPKPDLFVSFDRDPVAEVDNSGVTLGMYVYNYGEAPASDVTIVLDATGVDDSVELTEGDHPGCELTGRTVTCAYGVLDAGFTDHIHPARLASRAGAPPGDAGTMSVTISSAQEDANPSDNTVTFPVTVLTSGPDLVAVVDDINTEADPVGPGDTAPLHAAVANEGDSTADSYTIALNLPTGVGFVDQYDDCEYTTYWPNDPKLDGYAYGPSRVTCALTLPLAPGDVLYLVDEQGESLFDLYFGTNLAGPQETSGSFETWLGAGEPSQARASAASGKSINEALAKAQESAGRAASTPDEIDTDDNVAYFAVYTKPNTLDIEVTAAPVTGEPGDTVDLTYTVVNNGPSDGGGPGVTITAPTGTVLLPAEWCYTEGEPGTQLPESPALRCNFESLFPATASGAGRITHTVRLKVISTPGDDGTITAGSSGPSTESDPSDNTVPIVFTTAGGGAGGGGDDELPITGSSTGLIAAVGGATVLLGVLLVVGARRRGVKSRA